MDLCRVAAGVLRSVPRWEILVVKFEDIKLRPASLAQEVHRFLGVAERPADADGLGTINPSETMVRCSDSGSREQLLARYAEPNRRLAAMLGNDLQLW